ncbi:MAG: hypothetical protein JST01_25380 [Cyanobacteria bacterium SZAS TMP-1]|nr:hypothetical protein [Cyanobacteria bacterium SZAS TMP-1]
MIEPKVINTTLLLLVLNMFVGAPSAFALKSKAPEKMVDKVLLDHLDTRVLGRCRLYLSEQGGRFETGDGRVVAVCRPPTWELMLYAPKKKVCFSVDGKKINSTGLSVFNAPVEYHKVQVTEEYDRHLGLKLQRVLVDCGKQKMVVHDPVIFQSRAQRFLRDSVLKLTQKYDFKPEIQDFVHFIFNQNNFKGLPIELKNTYGDGLVETMYFTESIEYVKRPLAIFDYPVGMKRAADKLEVMMSEDANSTLEDLFVSPDPERKKSDGKRTNR